MPALRPVLAVWRSVCQICNKVSLWFLSRSAVDHGKQDLRLCLFHNAPVHLSRIPYTSHPITQHIHDIDSRTSRTGIVADVAESSARTTSSAVDSTGIIEFWRRHSHSRDRSIVGFRGFSRHCDGESLRRPSKVALMTRLCSSHFVVREK